MLKNCNVPRVRSLACFVIVIALCLMPALSASAQIALRQLSHDNFTNRDSQHSTEIEPDTFSFGSTIVATFQVGRAANGAASDTGWATTTDCGKTWASGNLQGISKIENPSNPWDRANDPAVAYDAAHAIWLIVTMPWSAATTHQSGGVIPDRPPALIPAAVVSRSSDGITWGATPVVVTPDVISSDKPWIACDNTPTSPFYGHCYISWDIPDSQNLFQMNTSTDGGLTWGPTLTTADSATGLGGGPVSLNDGTVVVPFLDTSSASPTIQAFTSTDGGESWGHTTTITQSFYHAQAANLRSGPWPSQEVDGAGRVFVVFEDCRFRTSCASNDILLTSSIDGVSWTPPSRIPIDPVTSTFDHFLASIAVDPNTSGTSAHLTVTYYYYPQTNCTSSTCSMNVGSISSLNGGITWARPVRVSPPMQMSWIALTNGHFMLGDYFSTSYCGGKAFGVFAIAKPKVGLLFNQQMYTTMNGLNASLKGPFLSSAGEKPVANPISDFVFDEEESESAQNSTDILPWLDLEGLEVGLSRSTTIALH